MFPWYLQFSWQDLMFSILLLSSTSLHCLFKKVFLSLLAILWSSAFSWVYLSLSPLPFACRRPGFDPWTGKVPWRRESLPTPVLWPGEFHGLYSCKATFSLLHFFSQLWWSSSKFLRMCISTRFPLSQLNTAHLQVCCCYSVAQLCPTLCDPMNCSTPGFTISQSLLKLMSIESVMPSNHLMLCHPLFLPPSVFPSIRVFSNVSAFHIKWPKYWSFSFRSSPSNEYSGLSSFRIDSFDLFAVQGTLKNLL